MYENTQVGPANEAIKRILAATVGSQFKGRKVSVSEIDRTFTYDNYLEMGSPTVAFISSADGSRAREALRPSLSRPTVRFSYEEATGAATDHRVAHDPFGYGACLVVWHRGRSHSVTIYIPELDAAALSVATDALIEKDKRKAAAALAHCGAYAGIAMAVAEAHAKTLAKGEAGTSKKSAARLTRDIEALIGRRL